MNTHENLKKLQASKRHIYEMNITELRKSKMKINIRRKLEEKLRK